MINFKFSNTVLDTSAVATSALLLQITGNFRSNFRKFTFLELPVVTSALMHYRTSVNSPWPIKIKFRRHIGSAYKLQLRKAVGNAHGLL